MINMIKLRDEIKLLSMQLRDHKSVIKSKLGHSYSEASIEWKNMGHPCDDRGSPAWGPIGQALVIRGKMYVRCERKARRITKLCVLKALCCGRTHLSPHSRLEHYHPRPKSLSEDDLLDWVSDEMVEFER